MHSAEYHRAYPLSPLLFRKVGSSRAARSDTPRSWTFCINADATFGTRGTALLVFGCRELGKEDLQDCCGGNGENRPDNTEEICADEQRDDDGDGADADLALHDLRHQ